MPARLPTVAARLGIDRAPIDLANADDALWLLACVWPDTARLPRTAAAMDLARQHRPPTMSGDMVTDLDAALDTFDPSLPFVVLTNVGGWFMLCVVREAVADETMQRLAQIWRHFGESECGTYSALYAAICDSVASDPDVLALVAAAPPTGQQPNVLLAAVHYLVLSGMAPALAEVYVGRADPDEAPALFRDVCLSQRHDIGRMLAGRHTQTNEPGRTALLAVGLVAAADLVGEPVGLLDAGCSAGLNLLIDRYRFDYGPAGSVGPIDSPVTITCELRGTAPVPARLPTVAARLGIDRAPIDLANADDALWLLACVWPDTARLPRTAAAMDLARQHRPPTMSGDMVTDLDAALDTFDPSLPIVVATTSACGYLSVEQRRAFLAILERRARSQPLAWLSAEEPGVVDIVPVPPTTGHANTAVTVLGLVTFENGTAVGRALGLCHAHGVWMEWADTHGTQTR